MKKHEFQKEVVKLKRYAQLVSKLEFKAVPFNINTFAIIKFPQRSLSKAQCDRIIADLTKFLGIKVFALPDEVEVQAYPCININIKKELIKNE